MIPTDYNKIYPELNGYLIMPLLMNPPMCKLHELKDGTYTIADLETMHQIAEIQQHGRSVAASAPQPLPTQLY